MRVGLEMMDDLLLLDLQRRHLRMERQIKQQSNDYQNLVAPKRTVHTENGTSSVKNEMDQHEISSNWVRLERVTAAGNGWIVVVDAQCADHANIDGGSSTHHSHPVKHQHTSVAFTHPRWHAINSFESIPGLLVLANRSTYFMLLYFYYNHKQ